MDMFVWSIFLFCGVLFESTFGFPNGQISVACNAMLPNHGNAVPQTSQAPYSISVSQNVYSAGDEVTVTLQGASFKGFLLQARTLGLNTDVGTFKIIDANSQGLQCSDTLNSAVSHTSNRAKTIVKAVWLAPARVGPVKFRATFVQSYNIFWTQVESQIMDVVNWQKPNEISNDTCGTQKFCFSSPMSCNPANDTMCYFMSFTPETGGGFIFEMSGTSTGYVAIGFSDDQIMGNDDIYICSRNATGQVEIQHAYSTGHTAPTIKPLVHVESTMVSYTNGVIKCSFLIRNNISLQARVASNQYYIFLAYGPVQNGQIAKHSQTPFITNQKVAMERLDSISANHSPNPRFTLLKVHGALMLIAWMTTGSIGMIIARYLKNTVKKSIMSKDIWFQTHWSLMMMTVTATIVAFVLAFVYVEGWSSDAGAHPILGCIVMILSFFQPIAALFRPAPKNKRRFIFNWAHALNALVIKVLAVAAIFLGFEQPSISGSGWMVKVMGGFVAWETLAYIILEINAQLEKKGVHKKTYGKVKKEMIVLLIYICGNLSFLIALLVGIGQL
ncbi:putative ferric-chelate reductase 1 [Microcaecilia unicolor]|uniref:Ferric-chelate reductase 1 n=1 Tax=Microcaecilia unicolor TaxID=1415580 RepID=A0A6P7YG66_9AMPH|nr:putative ferric-chelate reductase 1 [Microcaecilia unicolor]